VDQALARADTVDVGRIHNDLTQQDRQECRRQHRAQIRRDPEDREQFFDQSPGAAALAKRLRVAAGLNILHDRRDQTEADTLQRDGEDLQPQQRRRDAGRQAGRRGARAEAGER
jgi:hypothetical protein